MSSLLAFFFALLFCYASSQVQCLDESGNPADWSFLYKLGEKVTRGYGGYTYAYTDVNSDGSWKIGNLNNSNAVYHTVAQLGLYGGSASSSVGWGIWNDQTYDSFGGKVIDHENDGSGHIYGHSKGFIGFDSKTGFWMTHSAPGFPFTHAQAPNYWFFPRGQTIYAQTFFCVSIATADIDRIGSYLQYYHAFVYDSKIPSGMSLPNFSAFLSDKFLTTHGTISFKSLAGKDFVAIGKNQETQSDLYEDYVAPQLNTGLLVECWCGGTFGYDCLNSYCAGAPIGSTPSDPQKKETTYPWDAITITELSFGTGLSFPVTYNHGKWAIATTTSSTKWFCGSDINRAITQRVRGGGAVCTVDPTLWSAMYKATTKLDTVCPK